jgi:hypothetical protein
MREVATSGHLGGLHYRLGQGLSFLELQSKLAASLVCAYISCLYRLNQPSECGVSKANMKLNKEQLELGVCLIRGTFI